MASMAEFKKGRIYYFELKRLTLENSKHLFRVDDIIGQHYSVTPLASNTTVYWTGFYRRDVHIMKMEEVAMEDLPLYVGCKYIAPALSQIIKGALSKIIKGEK